MSTVSGADLLKRRRAQPVPTVSIDLCVAPDLVERHEELQLALAAAGANTTGDRLASGYNAEQRRIAQEIADLEAEIEQNVAIFTFRRLGRDEWQTIVDSNPPRDGNYLDAATGFDRDAVLDETIHKSLVSPTFDDCPGTRLNPETKQPEDCPHDDCGTYQEWAKGTSRGEWDEIRMRVNYLNGQVVENPKSELASRILGTPGSDSAPPAPTG